MYQKVTVCALIAILTFGFFGCSVVSHAKKPLPSLTMQDSERGSRGALASLFAFKNFTDTPQAGSRAANLVEGVLVAQGYSIANHLSESVTDLQKAQEIAKKEGSDYIVYGGVSEWRYKTGIDGEPAVSVMITIYETETLRVLWSATGSDSDWGNGSIGTTAHNLIEQMLLGE